MTILNRIPIDAPRHTPAGLPVTEAGFLAWLGRASRGEVLEYHRGFLARDTSLCGERLDEAGRKELVRLASRALWAAERQLVHLVQHRHGKETFAYLAIARPRLEAARHSVPTLISEETP